MLERHSLAAGDTQDKLEAARRRISSKCCSWDEARATTTPWSACLLLPPCTERTLPFTAWFMPV